VRSTFTLLRVATRTFYETVRGETQLRIYAVTVLSHYTDEYCKRQFGISTIRGAVRKFAQEGVEAGVDGIILPGTTLSVVEDMDVLKILTGLRPDFYQDQEQEQQYRPEDVAGRNDIEVVCGSPIMESSLNPVDALNRVLSGLSG